MRQPSLLPRICRIVAPFVALAALVALSPSTSLASGDALRIAAIGDYGKDGANEAAVADLVRALESDIVITAGDNSYSDNPIDDNVGKHYQEYIGNYVGFYGPGSPTNRFFPSLGNHDYGDGDGLPAYLAYFTLPGDGIANSSGNERYYDFVQGPVHFFAVNSNDEEPDGFEANSLQADWLRRQLAASTATWKIVYMHHPPYSSGDHQSSEFMRWPYAEWGATAVIAGHDHDYERIHRDGILYFVSGLGGKSRRDFGDVVEGSVVRYNEEYGTMMIVADESRITFEFHAIVAGGTLIDSVTVEAPVPDIVATPTAHDFGTVFLGSSATRTVLVENVGIANLNVSSTDVVGTDAAEFPIEAGEGPFTLAPGGSRDLVVRFAPGSAGARSATLRVTSDDPDEGTIDVTLSGVGEEPPAPELVVTPASHDFGIVHLGSSATVTIRVENSGTADLDVSSTSIAGVDAHAFFFESGHGPFVLPPGASRSLVVGFAPDAIGAKSGVLRIASNAPDGSPFDVPLIGTAEKPPAPEIVVTPLSHDFGVVYLGESPSLSIRIENRGNTDLSVRGTEMIGTDAAEFSVATGETPFSLGAGASRELTVRFTPTTKGSKNAALRISSDDPEQDVVDVALTGTGEPRPEPDIVVVPRSYEFGSVYLGSRASTTIRIENRGDADLRVASALLVGEDAAQFSREGEPPPFDVAPSTGRELVVHFSPSVVGEKRAVLRIESNDADEAVLEVALVGTGEPLPEPDIVATPTEYDFGAVFLGSHASQTIRVQNAGDAVLNVTGSSVTGGGSSEFSIENGAPFALAPGESRDLVASFAPVSPGYKSATLHIESDDPDEATLSVALAGTGEPPPLPDIVATPDEQDFGEVFLGAQVSRSVLVENRGDAELEVFSTRVTGRDAGEFRVEDEAFSLAPGAGKEIDVAFAPLSSRPKSAALRIESNDPDEGVLEVALSGTGAEPPGQEISIAPTAWDFGDVVIRSDNSLEPSGLDSDLGPGAREGSSFSPTPDGSGASPSGQRSPNQSTISFVVSNDGTDPLHVISVSIEQAVPGFSVLGPPGDATLAAGEARRFEVSFHPGSAGSKSAILRVESDDPDEPVVGVPLSGNGLSAPSERLVVLGNPARTDAPTSFRFVAPEGKRVTLEVFDVSGRRVATLVDWIFTSGSREIRWRGRDANGRPVAPGVYFARLVSGRDRALRKFVRLR